MEDRNVLPAWSPNWKGPALGKGNQEMDGIKGVVGPGQGKSLDIGIFLGGITPAGPPNGKGKVSYSASISG